MSAEVDWSSVPGQHKAKERGCLCEWWGDAIIIFDRDCPVLSQHWVPDSPAQWRHEMFPRRLTS